MSATTGSFSIGNSTVQMPVKTGTLGPSVVDISKLYAQSGMFTYDPGFTSTASCESEITYIDGDQGVLLYRGYPIVVRRRANARKYRDYSGNHAN